MWYKRKVIVSGGGETIFEIVTSEEGQGFGLAVAEVKESAPHLHRCTRETYVLIGGMLEVHIGDDVRVLEVPGQSLEIPLGVVHWAKSRGRKPARVLAQTIPPWSPDDHIETDKS